MAQNKTILERRQDLKTKLAAITNGNSVVGICGDSIEISKEYDLEKYLFPPDTFIRLKKDGKWRSPFPSELLLCIGTGKGCAQCSPEGEDRLWILPEGLKGAFCISIEDAQDFEKCPDVLEKSEAVKE